MSEEEIAVLSARLQPLMRQDVHQVGDSYEIRSVYFDDLWETCMEENEAGVDLRRKYRVRTYAPDCAILKLEIKEKRNGLTRKTACRITPEEYERLLHRGQGLAFGGRAPLNQLLLQMRCRGMAPKALICYERTAFVHPSGNVRITFDRNIMAGRSCGPFFDARVSGLIPVLPKGMQLMEVKYDELLPDIIARQLETGRLRQTAFSKYYLGRCAIRGEFPHIL